MKIMILADSCGLPRTFPEEARTDYHETYPLLLTKQYPDAEFFQLCMGGVTAPDLVGQAIAYFSKWEVDMIFIQVGIDDCRPEPVSNFTRIVLVEFEFLHRLRAYIYNPIIMKRLIKYTRPKYRVTPGKFKRNIKKIQAVFPNSEIHWMEIFTSESGGYEEFRPGVLARIDQYNGMIKKILKKGFVPIQLELNKVKGVNADHLHLNKNGHAKIFEILKERIEQFKLKKM